jgi:hypothetical protein
MILDGVDTLIVMPGVPYVIIHKKGFCKLHYYSRKDPGLEKKDSLLDPCR